MPVDFTIALGRLLRDPALRRRFRSDRNSVVAELQLSDTDRKPMMAIDDDELEEQAGSLIRKRFAEVSAMMPRTIAGLGDKGQPLFADYAATSWPMGHRRHLDDAVGFARLLAAKEISGFSDAELNAVTFVAGGARLALCLSHVVMGRRRRRALHFLFRYRGMPRQFFIYLAAMS